MQKDIIVKINRIAAFSAVVITLLLSSCGAGHLEEKAAKLMGNHQIDFGVRLDPEKIWNEEQRAEALDIATDFLYISGKETIRAAKSSDTRSEFFEKTRKFSDEHRCIEYIVSLFYYDVLESDPESTLEKSIRFYGEKQGTKFAEAINQYHEYIEEARRIMSDKE